MLQPKSLSWRVLALLALGLLLAAAAGSAAGGMDHTPIVVTEFDDDAPLPPDHCTPVACTLRQAVILANNIPGRDTIILPAGTYDLVLGYGVDSMYEDGALRGDIDVTDDLVIVGAGMDQTVITSQWLGPERAFDVLPGATLRVSGLTVSHIDGQWFRPVDCGVAFRNKGGVLALNHVMIEGNVIRGSGGGICNEEGGTLTVTDSILASNSASFFGQGGAIYNRDSSATLERVLVYGNSAYVLDGGGVYSEGNSTLVVKDSLIWDNATSPNAPFGPRRGGGIAAGGAVVLENVTISGNHSEGTDAVTGEKDSRGGGLYLFGQATLRNVTIANNESETSAGGIYVEPGAQVTMTNTIIAGNTGGDCEGTITSAGHNIAGDGSCGLSGPGDMTWADPMLAPLADNGGPTQTHALLPGSPAIDAGDSPACPEHDQRGAPRPSGAGCDIGAYEAGGAAPTPAPPTPTATPPPPAIKGDADCDLSITAADALAVLRFATGMPLYAECLFAANVDCDLDVDAADALLILRHVAALYVPPPPMGCPLIGQIHH